jgi:hypothetical protein
MENTIQSNLVSVIATSYVRETNEKVITRLEVIEIRKDIWAKYDSWTTEQVKEYYESYWNDWNPNSQNIVKVDFVMEGKIMTQSDFQ